MFNPSTRFRVGDAFSGDDESTAIVRLLIACRQLEALRRALEAARQVQTGPELSETLQFGYACVIGAAKEAADAFRDCDARGYFRWVEADPDALPDLAREIGFLRSACDRKVATSVYSRLLSPIRHNSAFHIDRKQVQEALLSLADTSWIAAETDEQTHMLGVPLARGVHARLGFLSVSTSAALGDALREIDEVRRALVSVGQDMYLVHVRLGTEHHEAAT